MLCPTTPPELACLYVPDFQLQASLNRLGGEPEGGLALVDPEAGRRRIVAASPSARLDGVRRGMTSVTATALAPELVVRPIHRADLAAVHVDLEEAVRHVTPQLESTGRGVIYASFRGLARRYADHGAGGFLDDLRDAALGLGLPARVGMAATRFAARCAAVLESLSGRPIVVPPGQEASFLAPRSIRLLPGAMEEIAILERLGIRTLGEFASLPAPGVARRLGRQGVELQCLARGEDRSLFLPSREQKTFVARMHAEFPVEQLEALLFLLRRPLSALLAELDELGLAAGQLRWTLQLEGAPPLSGLARAAAPSVSMQLWTDLLRLGLERSQLRAAVDSVELEALDVGPRCLDQGRMLGARQAPPGALSRSLSHLATELGSEGFGALLPRPALLPEDRQTQVAPGSGPLPRSSAACDDPWFPPKTDRDLLPVAFRRECPVQPIEVSLRGRQLLGFCHRGGALRAQRIHGPWDVSSRWWEEGQRRRYFQVVGDRSIAQIFLNPGTGGWFLDGWLD
ncbi:MAG: DNA polymerase Y family protein [Myxococcota bacterium]|nr:DNA polymerase Y family protein [Myxococcota bacterium]